MTRFRQILFVIPWLMSHIAAFAGEPPTILAFGDSITQGGETFVCYRQVLVPELQMREVAFQFIGPNVAPREGMLQTFRTLL